MGPMIRYYAAKVDSWFRRTFKEQAGGAELIATIVIIGVVLTLALLFREKITELVNDLWENLVGSEANKITTTSTTTSPLET